jgi:peroxiredoxin
MAIEPGQSIPNVMLKEMTPDGIKDVSTAEFLAGKKVIMFGVPGAYTPVCSTSHLPGFIEQADKLKSEGVDAIACVAVNDPFVMSSWGEMHGATGKVHMLCDPSAELTKALGLDLDLGAFGLGARSQRYSMVIENGVATTVNIEKSIFDHEASAASALLASAA